MRSRQKRTTDAFVAAAHELLARPSIKKMNGQFSPSTANYDVCETARAALRRQGLEVNYYSQRELIKFAAAFKTSLPAIGTTVRLHRR